MFTFIHYQDLPLLKRLRLPFMTASALQDPFIENTRVHRPASNQPLSDGEFSEAMEKSYQGLEPHIKAMVSFEYYLNQAKQNRDQIEKQLQRPKTPKQMGLASLDQYDKVACLRLFKNIYQQGLWQGMGFEHEGIALKLNDDHAYFRNAGFNQKPQIFAPVQYDDARPPMPSKQAPFPALLRRPEHFAYEQEWRLIRPVGALDVSKQGVINSKIPKGLVTGIYLGLKCPAEVAASLQVLVKQDLQFRGVSLKQLGVSETHLRLVATSLSS